MAINAVFYQRLVESQITPDVDAVFEVACGAGLDLAELAMKHPDTMFYGADLSPTARACVQRLAEIGGLANLHAVPFDIRAPDFSLLKGKRVLLISHMGLVTASPFPQDFFPALLHTVESVQAILLEPIGFELTDKPLFEGARARIYGLAENLGATMEALMDAGRITVHQVVPDLIGRNSMNAVSLVRFTGPNRDP